MTTSVLVATSGGPGIQQHVLAEVPPTLSPHGDYAVQVGVTHLLPGAVSEEIRHDVPEAVVVVTGELEMWTDGDPSTIRTGDHFVIASGSWHRFANRTNAPAAMIYAFGGDPVPVTCSRQAQPDVEGTT